MMTAVVLLLLAAVTPPRFVGVAVAEKRVCVVDAVGALSCFGVRDGVDAPRVLPFMPAPQQAHPDNTAMPLFAEVAITRREIFVRGTDGVLTCVGCTSEAVVVQKDVVDVAVGYDTICVVDTTGRVSCGKANGDPLQPVAGLTDAVAVVDGDGHACAIRRDRRVVCWGSNEGGQLGRSPPTSTTALSLVDKVVDVVDVGARRGSTCVVTASGKARCWGERAPVQWPAGVDPSIAVDVKRLDDAVAVDDTGTCFTRRSGAVVCADGSDLLVEVRGIQHADDVALAHEQLCAIDHGVLACGGGSWVVPRLMNDVVDATRIAVGAEASCAITKTKALRCVGRREVGDGDDSRGVDSDVAQTWLEDVSAVTMGRPSSHRYDVCAVHGAGAVTCWHRGKATTQAGIDDAIDVATGQNFACALRRGGGVACWGDSMRGQAGPVPRAGTSDADDDSEDNSDDDEVTAPTAIAVRGAVKIAAGGDTACAIKKGGSVVCWGSNANAMLGSGKPEDSERHPTPVAVRGLDDAIDIDVGYAHVCAVRRSGQVVCWGSNISDAAYDAPLVLTRPKATSIRDAVAISSGNDGSCVVRRGGRVACWKVSDVLRTGVDVDNGTDISAVAGLTDAVDVEVAQHHACAVSKDGRVRCWGNNAMGQLGSGGTTRSVVVVP